MAFAFSMKKKKKSNAAYVKAIDSGVAPVTFACTIG
jgi:hypothetical protein